MSVNKYDATHDLLLQIAGSGSEGSFHRTSPVQALAGATSVTITDSRIHATSLVFPFADNGTNESMSAPSSITLTEGQCVLTFDALEADTDFTLVVLADSLTEDAYLNDLTDVNISNPTNGQVLGYNGATGEWVNVNMSGGLMPHLVITSEPSVSVVVTKGQISITATETSSGVYECDVPEFGTYTLSDTENTKDVVIDTVTIYQIPMTPPVPEGATVTPTDDIQKWLNCAGIFDKVTYTTLADVLADSTTLLALISDNNAVDYLVRSTTWASGITANSTAMTDIGANNYCANTLLDDSTWCDAICNSTYFESVLNVKVPTMTGNTTPSGVVSYTTEDQGAPYTVFGGGTSNPNAGYAASRVNVASTLTYIQYQFANANKCKKLRFYNGSYGSAGGVVVYLQGSNDGTSWTDLSSGITISPSNNTAKEYTSVLSNNDAAYKYYRLSNKSSSQWTCFKFWVQELQFYGRKDV